jgi:hypothetical protein
MNASPTSAGPTRHSLQPKFVLVNDRVPRIDANCALCCAKIESGYVRDPQTRLVYCDPHCFIGHEKMAMAVIVSRSRRAS